MRKGQIAEAVGFITVVISLLFVAYQISESNNIAIVTNEIEINDNYALVAEAMMLNPDFAALLYKTEDPNFVVEGQDRVILEGYVYTNLIGWRSALISYDRGLLDQTSYDLMSDDIQFTVERYPALRPLWRSITNGYPSTTSNPIIILIDQLLDE